MTQQDKASRGGVCEWITLRRIRDQTIVVLGGSYYDCGILLGGYVAGTVRELITEERVRPVQGRGYFRLVLTPRGQYRLAALERITIRRLRLAHHEWRTHPAHANPPAPAGRADTSLSPVRRARGTDV